MDSVSCAGAVRGGGFAGNESHRVSCAEERDQRDGKVKTLPPASSAKISAAIFHAVFG